MKTMKLFRLFSLTAIVAVGLIFSLSNCKREKEIVVVTVHDSIKGKNISGLVTYPNYSGVTTNADGAVLTLYTGNTAIGTPVATTFADVTGNYTFKFLVAGNYCIKASYNTTNVNNKGLDGVTFTTAGVPVLLASTNLTQNIALTATAPTGSLKIGCYIPNVPASPSADSTAIVAAGYLPTILEGHSKVSFTGMHNMNQQDLAGGFNGFVMKKFIFDEANPANIVINAFVRTAVNYTNSGATPTTGINTFEPSRDQIGSGCVSKTLLADTTMAGTVISVIPATDTIRFYANAGEVVKYGKGYLAHGHMKGFYHHSYGNRRPPIGSMAQGTLIPADTSYLQTADAAAPYNQYIDKPVDMYFEYQFKKLQGTVPATATWEMVFEGTFTFNKTAWYVKSTSISDLIKVDIHVAMQGLKGKPY